MVTEFLCRTDLWISIIGGVVTAGLLALVAYLWNWRRHKILSELTEIMGRAIQHRNEGANRTYSDEEQWINTASSLKKEAVSKATQLSPTAGSLVNWMDRVQPWDVNDDVEKWVSFLSKTIERIRELLERNS